MNFLILEDYPFIQLEHLSYLVEKWHRLIGYNEHYDAKNIDAIIINIKNIDSTELDKYPSLKYVCRTWVWLDMIDLAECKKRNIEVINTPWANTNSVCDITIWWIISLMRKTYLSFEWLDDSFNFLWKKVGENTVAIFWFWAIGKWIYTRMKAFWVDSFYIYDPFLTTEQIAEFEFCTKSDDKEFLCKNCDIISLNLPLVKETYHFIWEKEFALFKDDVAIANSARWSIIDEISLIEFLKKNKNAGAYLDVWENEPANPNPKLRELQNCIITPHIWAMTKSAYKRMHEFKIFM